MNREKMITDVRFYLEADYVDSIMYALRRVGFFVSIDAGYNFKNRDWRIVIMAKESKKIESDGLGKWNGIANVSIGDDHKQRAQAIVANEADLLVSEIHDLVASNYSLSIKWDRDSDCPMVSLSCYDPQSPNFKFTLVTRAPSWMLALALTIVKHNEICEGDWGGSPKGDVWG